MNPRRLFQLSMVLSLLMMSCILSTSLYAQVQNKRVKPPVENPVTPPGPEGSVMFVPSQTTPEENLLFRKAPKQTGPRINQGTIVSPFTTIDPVIDGVMSPGEWTDAVYIPAGGFSTAYYNGNTNCGIWFKNTCLTLYMATFNAYGTVPNGAVYKNFSALYFDTYQGGDYTYCSYNGGAYPDREKSISVPGDATYPYNVFPATDWVHGNRHYASCDYQWWCPQAANDDHYPNGTAGVTWAMSTTGAGSYFEFAIDFQNSKLKMPIITSTGDKLRAAVWIGTHVVALSGAYIYGGWQLAGPWYPIYSYAGWDLQDLIVTGPPPGSGGLANIAPVTLNTSDFVWRSNQSIQWSTTVDATPNQPLTAVTELYGPNTPSAVGPLVKTQTDNKLATATPQLWNVTVPLYPPTLVTGFYDLYTKITFTGTCGPVTKTQHWKIFVAQPGEGICYVWSGDVNNNGACNLADRQALNTYMYNANTRPSWLNGPVRFRVGEITGSTTALDIFTWVQQPAKMWQTPEGCYMDADGNGTVNNFDLFALKFNIGKSHTYSPKSGNDVNIPMEFDLAQNYPNPFNPTTNIHFALPEESFVNLKVTDVLGREVKVLVNETVAAGTHNAVFNAIDLPSGVYYYAITAHGLTSGSDFTRTLKMSLTK